MKKTQHKKKPDVICCNFCPNCDNACGMNHLRSEKNQTISLEITRYENSIQEENQKEFATKIIIASEKEIRFYKNLNFSEAVQALAKILEKEEEESWLYSGTASCIKCGNSTARVLGDADSVVDCTRICIECGHFPQNCACQSNGDDIYG